jgi:hypothetical protein
MKIKGLKDISIPVSRVTMLRATGTAQKERTAPNKSPRGIPTADNLSA